MKWQSKVGCESCKYQVNRPMLYHSIHNTLTACNNVAYTLTYNSKLKNETDTPMVTISLCRRVGMHR